jgi:hypothetical protein
MPELDRTPPPVSVRFNSTTHLERNKREREKRVHVPGPVIPAAVTTTRRYCCGWPGGKKCCSAHCSA